MGVCIPLTHQYHYDNIVKYSRMGGDDIFKAHVPGGDWRGDGASV